MGKLEGSEVVQEPTVSPAVAQRGQRSLGHGRPPRVSGPRRSERASAAKHHGGSWSAFAFILPALALVAVLLLVPFVVTVGQSFTHDNGFTSEPAGLANYIQLFQDPAFGRSLLNTFMWTAGTLVLPVGIGLIVAVFTDQMRGGRWIKYAFILPYALSGTATAVIWGFILRSDGALNQVIELFGGSGSQGWLLSWPSNTIVMILASTWQATGVAVILFLVGLQGIPAETVEAAALDGAGPIRQFLSVILPQLRAASIIVIGMSIANSLRVFDLIWLMTGGGPGYSSETLAVTMYRQTFVVSHYGYGAAVAVILAIVVVGASWVYLRRQLKVG